MKIKAWWIYAYTWILWRWENVRICEYYCFLKKIRRCADWCEEMGFIKFMWTCADFGETEKISLKMAVLIPTLRFGSSLVKDQELWVATNRQPRVVRYEIHVFSKWWRTTFRAGTRIVCAIRYCVNFNGTFRSLWLRGRLKVTWSVAVSVLDSYPAARNWLKPVETWKLTYFFSAKTGKTSRA